MSNVSGIYKIYNKLKPDYVYVGKTITITGRHKKHFNDLKAQRHANIHLQNAWNKYGEENFVFELIEEVEREQLSEREAFWVQHYDSYKNGFNMTPGGESNPMDNPESRAKISLKVKGLKRTKEHIEKAIINRDGKINLIHIYSSITGDFLFSENGYKNIADKLNICTSIVERICKGKTKTAANKYHFSLIEKTKEEVLKDCERLEMSEKQKTRMSILGKNNLIKILQKKNTPESLEKRRIKEEIKVQNRKSKILLEEIKSDIIINMYSDKKLTQVQIADSLKCTQATVSRHLRKNGIIKFRKNKTQTI